MKRYIKKVLGFGFIMMAILASINSASKSKSEVLPAVGSGTTGSGTNSPSEIDTTFFKGADISWLPQMEATGFKFYDENGKAADCLDILKDNGINAIRLRVFVHPSDDKISGHCSTAETLALAKRCLAKGFKIMIDFHYSDSWADPSHQNKPAVWQNDDLTTLLQDVYDYTYHVLDTLKSQGVTPTWVQVGNEITGGMLWPTGSTDNWPALSKLLNKGYAATKAVDPSIKVIVHIDQGNNNSRSRWFYDSAKANNVNYDIIGLSYYPFWLNQDYTENVNDLNNNLNDMVSRYNKPVMVVEVGGADMAVQNTYDMLKAVIKTTAAVPGNRGLGVFYWEPEGARSWSEYKLSCWQSDGKPTKALSAFK
ncbi:arabinogalactan endo-1,4-beta-galactosidase [Arachidicoccus rhizosphaerae]|uniref:Arabinogalactan endo-beta-1,4-galactanase n=1 Tax=Arachidicoccus rhizosphaerae TaxID=551991 RepID=A0A1H3VQY7_9BACT|nr:glycosyl hydrolase 53 family protein [Arachidicoccus rhizosphaerae]SDZ77225.1 arabinogalactan endo-1,4-beta-galactosidase [Arachidicoccus rhizosphaerae]